MMAGFNPGIFLRRKEAIILLSIAKRRFIRIAAAKPYLPRKLKIYSKILKQSDLYSLWEMEENSIQSFSTLNRKMMR